MSAEAESRIEAILDPGREEEMNRALDRQKDRVKQHEHAEPDGINVGLEEELFVLDGNEPVNESTRDELIGKLGKWQKIENVEHELGAAMAEIATEPVRGLSALDQLYEAAMIPQEELIKRAQKMGLEIVRHGTNPALDLQDVERTTEDKYRKAPNTYGEMRVDESVESEFGEVDTLDPRNEEMPATICSSQLNMQADSLEDAVEKANIGYAISPYITAISGNSRLHEPGDLGHQDSRIPLWERAFDIGEYDKDELDIGRIDRFFQDIDDVFERMREQPRIMNSAENEEYALDIAQGMFWKDVRIKTVGSDESGLILEDDVVVEFRQNSTQPSLLEDVAVQAFYMGRIIYEQEEELGGAFSLDDLPDIDKVNHNRREAMANGMETQLYDWQGNRRDAGEVIGEELDKAREGLEYAGVDYSSDYMDMGYIELLEQRLETGVSPSDEVVEEFYRNLLDEGYRADMMEDQYELPENYDSIDKEKKKQAAVEAVKSISMRPPENIRGIEAA